MIEEAHSNGARYFKACEVAEISVHSLHCGIISHNLFEQVSLGQKDCFPVKSPATDGEIPQSAENRTCSPKG